MSYNEIKVIHMIQKVVNIKEKVLQIKLLSVSLQKSCGQSKCVCLKWIYIKLQNFVVYN